MACQFENFSIRDLSPSESATPHSVSAPKREGNLVHNEMSVVFENILYMFHKYHDGSDEEVSL